MTGFGKFLVGAAATSLLAFGAHALNGKNYIDSLGERASGALGAAGMEGVGLAMQDDPLARIAVLSGITDPAARASAQDAVLAVRGIAAVRWADGEGAGTDASAAADTATPPAPEAAAAEVTACQGDVDEAMAGKVINFRSGSAYLVPGSLRIIDEVAEALGNCADLNIAVGGHTDATGNDEVNQVLSQQRADQVAQALIDRGIDARRVSATGYGSTQPVMPGTSPEANAANRRIAFTLGEASANASGEGRE